MTGVIVMIRLIRTRKREPVETERTGKYGDEGDDAPRIRTPAMTSGFLREDEAQTTSAGGKPQA